MIHVCPIRVSAGARAVWQKRGAGHCIAIQFHEIRGGGCCAAGAAVQPLLLEWHQVEGPEWVHLGRWDGVPVVVHRALLPFLEAHTVEIDAGGLWPFRCLRVRSDVDLEMWCLFGDQPFSSPVSQRE